MLGADIDTDELTTRYNPITFSHVYIADTVRHSIIFKLSSIRLFSTTGNFDTPILPMFFFTASNRHLNIGTSRRLTIQALPITSLITYTSTNELCCLRGFPDNCHTILAIFSLLWRDLNINLPSHSDFLPILTSTMVRRGQQFVDEVFLRIHTSLPSELNLQTDLGLTQTALHHAVLSWQGQIAPSQQNYRNSNKYPQPTLPTHSHDTTI